MLSIPHAMHFLPVYQIIITCQLQPLLTAHCPLLLFITQSLPATLDLEHSFTLFTQLKRKSLSIILLLLLLLCNNELFFYQTFYILLSCNYTDKTQIDYIILTII